MIAVAFGEKMLITFKNNYYEPCPWLFVCKFLEADWILVSL